ncbi:DNA-binding response regulator [Streptomyces sp. NPDC014802]|uniref:helix-turn-helix transcriptional regulator n=1 Tax=Streptomyces sp. NPDC014802 TaxID=3364917 RepID=UPI0036FC8545
MTQLLVTTSLHVLAHTGLQGPFSTPGTPLSSLRAGLDRVDFVDDAQLAAPGDPRLPILLPVSSELQADRLRALRTRHAMALLIAVTDDVSGHLTYQAIRSGANVVFNLAIPEERQIDLLLARCRAHGSPDADSTGAGRPAFRLCVLPDGSPVRPPAPADGTPLRSPAPADGARSALAPRPDGYDAALLRMLCTSATVSEIARRNYCSERSMYRRIRKLYDAFGVSGRSELHARAAELGLIDAPGGPVRRAG